MFKIIFSGLIIGILLVIGCSRDTEPLPRARDINVLIFADTHDETFIRSQIEDFHRFNWNAKIRLHVRPADFSALEELERMEEKGQPIDLIYFESRELFSLVSKGKLIPLDNEAEIEQVFEAIVPELKQKLTYKDRQFALPFSWSTTVLLFNKKIFDSIGISYPSEYWGWPDVLESAQAASMDTDRDGKIDQYGIEMQGKADEIIMMYWQFEGKVPVSPVSLENSWDQENRLILDQTIDFYSDMEKEMDVGVINSKKIQDGFFESGKAAVTFGQWKEIKSLMQSEHRGLWQIAPSPRGREKATLLECKLLAIPQKSTHKTEAKALAQFLLRSEAQKLLVFEGVGLPVLSALKERTIAEGRADGWAMESFYVQLSDAQIAPVSGVMKEIQTVLDQRLKTGRKLIADPTDKPSFKNRLKLRMEQEKK